MSPVMISPVITLLCTAGVSASTMWFQPGLWGQPQAPPGVTPIDPPDPSSGYLSALDQFLRPKAAASSEPEEPPAVVQWLGKWREWVQAKGGDTTAPQPPEDNANWWTERMNEVKSLYEKTVRGTDDEEKKKRHTTTQTGGPPPGLSGGEKTQSPDDEILLPSKEILNGLRCRPLVSFQSCAEHCHEVMPPVKNAPSLTTDLIPRARARRAIFSGRKLAAAEAAAAAAAAAAGAGSNSNSTVGERTPQLGNPDEWDTDGWEPWQIAQFKSCVFGVCVADYLKRPVPGCLGSDGRLVPLTETAAKKVRGAPAEFDDYDFYNPKRLEFWRGLGFYTFTRFWHQLRGGLFLPVVVLLGLLALPAFIVAIALPTVMSYHEWQCDDLWVKSAEPLVRWLSDLATSALNTLRGLTDPWTTIDAEEISVEMAKVNSPAVADVMKRKLVTHGEAAASAATIDTTFFT